MGTLVLGAVAFCGQLCIVVMAETVRRHEVRPSMVEHGVIRWLVPQLSHLDTLAVTALECCGALLMNLALSKAGRQECKQVREQTSSC